MSKTVLIALVRVVAFVEGKREEFAPGSELPELPEHDVAELKRMGAIEDVAETAAAEKNDAKAQAAAGAEFQKERKAVQAAKSSTAAPAAEKKAETAAEDKRDAKGEAAAAAEKTDKK